MRNREIIPNYGPDSKNIVTGIEKALQAAVGKNMEITIIIPNISSIDGVLEILYGSAFLKAIKKGTPIQFEGKKITINIVSDRTMTSFNVKQIALCIYVTSKMLEKINDFPKIVSEIVIPWIEDDVRIYRKTWELGGSIE